MMKPFAIITLLLWVSMPVMADIAQPPAHGFHWYSSDEKKKRPLMRQIKPQLAPAPQISPYEKLMAIRKETLNKLAQALVEPSFEATHEYMKAQQGYAKNNQQFVRYWQQVLMLHPELDHTLNFPTDNSAIAIQNDTTNALMERVVKEGTTQYGLILFYRGNSSISQKFVSTLMPFVNETHFSMISVSTDGQPIRGLPNPKTIPLADVKKTVALESRYMPALFLVNLKTQKMSPLSYGYVSLTELKERLLDIATNYKRFSYEGLGE